MNGEIALLLLFYFWKIKLEYYFFQKYMSLNHFPNKKNLNEFIFLKKIFSSAKMILDFAVFKDMSIIENGILWYFMNA